MNTSEGSVPPNDALKAARARLTSAEVSVTAAKQDAKAAKKKRQEAKEAARRAKKRLRRAKKELIEARRVLARAEEEQPRAVVSRQLKPIAPAKTLPPASIPRPIVPRKRRARPRVAPQIKPNTNTDGQKHVPSKAMNLRVNSGPTVAPPNSKPPAAAPPELTSEEPASQTRVARRNQLRDAG